MPWLDKETGLHAEQTHAEVFVTIDYKDAIHIVSFLHPFDEEDNEDTLKADIDKLLEKGYHNELFYEILESKPEEEVGQVLIMTEEIDVSDLKAELLEFEKINRTQSYTSDIDHSNSFACLLYTSPSPRDRQKSRMPSSA